MTQSGGFLNVKQHIQLNIKILMLCMLVFNGFGLSHAVLCPVVGRHFCYTVFSCLSNFRKVNVVCFH